jgi:phosphatidylglycerol---prolipoprotein diacylglyceryl transferase
MFPVLFSLGPISFSSFGLLLCLGFLFGSFLIWRLARAWELSEEKILDLSLLTFFGGLFGARVYFVLFNLSQFDSFYKAMLITKYPGLSFWGALIGGLLGLILFSKRLRFNFWQVGDLAAIGLLGGMILGDIGCFLGGCDVGVRSNLFLATEVVGVIDQRLPISLIEALLLIYILRKLWPQAIRFHFQGKILSLFLILLGIIKLITQPFRDPDINPANVAILGYVISVLLILLGGVIYYKNSKGSFVQDLRALPRYLFGFFIDPQARLSVIEGHRRNWYNGKARFKNFGKTLRRIRVKPTPKNF